MPDYFCGNAIVWSRRVHDLLTIHMKKIIYPQIVLLLAHGLVFGQSKLPLVGVGGTAAAGGATPVFVSESSFNSTTNADVAGTVTTRAANTTTCVDHAYCFQYADTTLVNNLGVIFYQYHHASTSVTATATDDAASGGNTYTCGASVQVGATGTWVNYCYTYNMKVAYAVTITFGTTDVTAVMGKAQTFYNILASGDPLDAASLASGSSSSTVNSASVTTTAANDMVTVFVARVGTPAVTSFTAGSGYTLGTEDIKDGGVSEYGVVAGTGATTPSMTMASSSTYGEIVLAFKSATAGTAPSGEYIERKMNWSSSSTTTGAVTFQFTSAGNFLFVSPSCGGSPGLSATTITDSGSVNTWTTVGTVNTLGAVNIGPEFAASGATANATGLYSMGTSGTGDCTWYFYSVKGAPSTTVIARAPYNRNFAGATASTVWELVPTASGAATEAGWIPTPSNGMVFLVGGQDSNTSLGVASPSANCKWDAGSFGGEPISGLSAINENNSWAHCYFSGSGGVQWDITQTSAATTAPGNVVGDAIGIFDSSTGDVAQISWVPGEGTGTNLDVTIPSTTSGNLLVCSVGVFNSTARTISSVCLDLTTCAGGNAFTQLSNSTSTGTGHAATSIWYLLSAPAGKTSVRIHPSATATTLEATCFEVRKGTGSWATDTGNHTNNGSASSNTITGAAITTTGAIDFCAANVGVTDSVSAAPKAGSEWQYSHIVFHNSADAAISLITTSASAHTPTWTDSAASGSFSSSIGCFK